MEEALACDYMGSLNYITAKWWFPLTGHPRDSAAVYLSHHGFPALLLHPTC